MAMNVKKNKFWRKIYSGLNRAYEYFQLIGLDRIKQMERNLFV